MIFQKLCIQQSDLVTLIVGDLFKKTATNYCYLSGLSHVYAVNIKQKVWLNMPNHFLGKNKVML